MIQPAQSISPLQFTIPKGNVRLDDFDPLLELQSLRRKWESQSSSSLSCSLPSVPPPHRDLDAVIAVPISSISTISTLPPLSAPDVTEIPFIEVTESSTDTKVNVTTATTVRTQSDTMLVSGTPSSYVVAELSGWFFMAVGLSLAMIGSLFFLRYTIVPESPRWEMDVPLALLGSLICSLGLCVHQWRLHQMMVRMSVCADKINTHFSPVGTSER